MEGKAPQPFEHYIGRLSEEFGGALPTAVFQELQRLPVGFMEQVIEYRRFAEAVQALKSATTPAARQALGGGLMLDLAEVIEFEVAEEEMKGANG